MIWRHEQNRTRRKSWAFTMIILQNSFSTRVMLKCIRLCWYTWCTESKRHFVAILRGIHTSDSGSFCGLITWYLQGGPELSQPPDFAFESHGHLIFGDRWECAIPMIIDQNKMWWHERRSWAHPLREFLRHKWQVWLQIRAREIPSVELHLWSKP